MKAYISNDGEILAEYAIAPEMSISADDWAARYATDSGGEVDPDCLDRPASYIPCGGHFTVTIAEPEQGAFGASCWQSRNYYFRPDSETEW